MSASKSSWLIPLILVLGLAAGLLYLSQRSQEPPVVAVPAQPDPPPAADESPRHPLPAPVEAEPEIESPPLPPLPALDDSDEFSAHALVDLFGADIDALLVDASLIEKFVTTVDNLSRSRVAEKVRPLQRISGLFPVEMHEDGKSYSINPDNYGRYDVLVDLATSVSADSIAAIYRHFYPLLQEAYVNLGYPDGYFNDRVIETIDHLLDTPHPEESLALVRPHVLYEYADPRLEALSSGQKLLLRMGSQHAARIKQQLRELRAQLADNN